MMYKTMHANRRQRFCCFSCDYFTNSNSDLKKHFLSQKHIVKQQIIQLDPSCKYQCKICFKKYASPSGVWRHNQKCKVAETTTEEVAQTIPQLSNEIKELKSIIIDLVKNQQPSVVNNNNNINNNFNINIFLNDKCGNACNMVEFIDKIEFKYEHFEKFLLDYVKGNADVIEEKFNEISPFERPLYCFTGEDQHQSIAHIQHEKKWVVEPEIAWERQVESDQDNTCEEDSLLNPNSMYSLVRMFDMKKLKYFNEKCLDSHLRYKQRKLEKDTCNTDFQKQLIKKLIKMATVNPIEMMKL
jgi:hypothetical protein